MKFCSDTLCVYRLVKILYNFVIMIVLPKIYFKSMLIVNESILRTCSFLFFFFAIPAVFTLHTHLILTQKAKDYLPKQHTTWEACVTLFTLNSLKIKKIDYFKPSQHFWPLLFLVDYEHIIPGRSESSHSTSGIRTLPSLYSLCTRSNAIIPQWLTGITTL